MASMNPVPSALLGAITKSALFLVLTNELRGLILAGPVLYGMYAAGGALMTIWLGCCSLAGIGLSVAVPMVAMKRLRAMAAGAGQTMNAAAA
jgi:hypothetical protein